MKPFLLDGKQKGKIIRDAKNLQKTLLTSIRTYEYHKEHGNKDDSSYSSLDDGDVTFGEMTGDLPLMTEPPRATTSSYLMKARRIASWRRWPMQRPQSRGSPCR